MFIAENGVAAERQSLHKSYTALEDFIDHQTTIRGDSEKGRRSIFDSRWLLYVETDKSGHSTIKVAKSFWEKFSHCYRRNTETRQMLAVEGDKVLRDLSMRELRGERLDPQDLKVKQAIKRLISPQNANRAKAVLKSLSLSENEMNECWEAFKATRIVAPGDLGQALHQADEWKDLGHKLVGSTLLAQADGTFASKPLKDLESTITNKRPLIVAEMNALDENIAAKTAEIEAKRVEMPEIGPERAHLKQIAEKLGTDLYQHLISKLDKKYLKTDSLETAQTLQNRQAQLQRLCIGFFGGDIGEGLGMERNKAASKKAVVQVLQMIKHKGERGMRTETSFMTSEENWDNGIKECQATPQHKELLELTNTLKQSEAEQEMRKKQEFLQLRQELRGLQTLRSDCEQNLAACGNEEKSIAQFTLFSSIKRNLGSYFTAENRETLRKLCNAYCDGITPKDTARENIERFVARVVPDSLKGSYQALAGHSMNETDQNYIPTLVDR